ncbi:MAG: citramalate synthase, partial [Epsilonproteobacteria bacterium]|nr:citramalate synthase [Campylobacterota bacterium]
MELIYESIRYILNYTDRVIYDAEHFFDGYIANKEYAIKTIKAAQDAGADTIVLCETNGGRLPGEVSRIIEDVKKSVTV